MLKRLYTINESGHLVIDFEALEHLSSKQFAESILEDLAAENHLNQVVSVTTSTDNDVVSAIIYSKFWNYFHIYEYRKHSSNPYNWMLIPSSEFEKMSKVFKSDKTNF